MSQDHNGRSDSGSGASSHSTGGGFWTAVRVLNVRLRFIFLMVLVGLITGYWDHIMNHVDRWRRPAQAAIVGHAHETEFYCPMHPNIIRSEPSNCPICGMPLAQRAKTDAKALPPGVLAQVQLTPLKVQLGRIGTSPVEYRLLSREVRTVGIVDYDETRRSFIAARIKGRIEKLMVNYVGQRVEKGDPLVAIYSPDLLVAQEELLGAVRNRQQQKDAGEFAAAGARALVEASRKKLLLWGITDEQIDEILRRGEPQTNLTLFSPMTGIVTEKKVLEGQYVSEGQDLYTIADLSQVWMQAKIFEDQVAGIDIGTAVAVTSTAYPNELFAGRITFMAYTVEPATRTVSARVEVANPDLKLKPGMYAEAVIRLPAGRVTELAAATQPTSTGPADQPAGAAPATAAAETASPAKDLVRAYLTLAAGYTKEKVDAAAVDAVIRHARALAATDKAASAIAGPAEALKGKDLKTQREQFKQLSAKLIEYVKAHPLAGMDLFIANCPMVEADWLQDTNEVANPYDPVEMLRCGLITGEIKGVAASGPSATQPATPTLAAAKAYLAVSAAYAQDKADAGAVDELIDALKTLAAKEKSAEPVAELAAGLKGKDLKQQREAFKGISAKMIPLLKALPPAGLELYVAHCPMAAADWVQDARAIANPYYGSEMLTCGEIKGEIKPGGAAEHAAYATGYFCPIYPTQLFDHPADCPIDQFPMKHVRLEKVLAVPESAVINTGTRHVVYREGESGFFDMIEVQVGPRAGEFFPVTSGLREGDRVATAGAFLVDAENRLNPSASAQYFGATGK